MGKIILSIGVALLVLAVIAVGLYVWHGQWGAVLLTLASAPLGKMALGFVEIVFIPVTLLAIFFAKRGSKFLSICFVVIYSIATRSAYAAYCILILAYFLRKPGPPVWLIVILATAVAGVPFNWAERQASENKATNIDMAASVFGVLAAGALFAYGASFVLAVTPIALLFLVSAIQVIIWWSTIGLSRARIMASISN